MKKNFIITLLLTIGVTVGVGSVASAKEYQKVRLGGADRYETAIQVSREFAKNETIENCIIANSENFADSISATPLSVYKNAPILLTQSNALNEKTKARLAEMQVKNVFLLGGEGVVSPAVEAELKAAGYNVVRIGGQDRAETNKKIMAQIPASEWGPNPKIVNSYDWRQGMSIAMDVKYTDNRGDKHTYINPVFVVSPTAYCREDLKAVADLLKPSRALWENKYKDETYVVELDTNVMENATKAMPEEYRKYKSKVYTAEQQEAFLQNMSKELKADIKPCTYIHSAYALNNNEGNFDINNSYADKVLHNIEPYQETSALLTNGSNFPDALSVSALAAKRRMPIVMADKTAAELGISESAVEVGIKNAFCNVNKVYFIGGQGVMPDSRIDFFEGK